jgi:isopentenyldiphosphate isomerase
LDRPALTAAAGAELVDIVDDDDRVQRVVTRREMRAGHLRHRSVGIIIWSTRGEVLVHRRADDKDVWPGRFDLAVGGVVASGETYDDAARRELVEEIGVAAPIRFVRRASYSDTEVNEAARIYSVVSDGPFDFNDAEVVEAFFVERAELQEFVTARSFVPDSLALCGPALGLSIPA